MLNTLLMSPSANTILSFLLGFSSGAVAVAVWFGREAKKWGEESGFDEFDEADLY